MLLSVELKAELKELLDKAEAHLSAGELKEAQALKESIEEKKLAISEALKAEKIEKTEKGGKKLMFEKKMSTQKALNMAVKAHIAGKEIPENVKMEVAADFNGVGNYGHMDGEDYDGSRGGYLIPIEMLPLKEIQGMYPTLRPYVETITTATRTGWLPISKYNGSENYADALIAFDELDEISKANLTFGKLDYKVKDYGLIIPVSRQLIEDATSDVLGLIARNFLRRQAMLENAKILEILDSTTQTATVDTTASAAALFIALKTAYNQTLVREYGRAAKIITNRTGLNMLDTAVDNEGRFILERDVRPDVEPFSIGGHTVIVLDNEALPDDETNGTPFYVGDFFSAAAIVDRKALEIASDASAGFTSNSVLVRAISRFDFLVKDIDAIVKINATA